MPGPRRSRRRLDSTHCYLCALPIGEGDRWDRDHVPPKRVFGKRMRSRLNPQLNWLPTHTACNSSFRADEEYAITALFPMALTHDHRAIPTPAAASVLEDIVQGRLRGHGNNLNRSMIKNWGTVVGPRSEVRVTLDFARIDRVMSKLARGLYCLEMDAVLPLSVQLRMDLYTSMMVEQAQARPEIRAVIDTASMGKYPDVFDYRWGCFLTPEGFRGNLIVMLWWASLLVAVSFIDPTSKHDSATKEGP